MASRREDSFELIFQQSFPNFLRQLHEGDIEGGWTGFDRFARQLLQSHPPQVFRELTECVREDLANTVIEKCCKEEFHALLAYRDQGRPFSCWLATIATNTALDHLRHLKIRTQKLSRIRPLESVSVERLQQLRRALEIMDRFLATLMPLHQQVLEMAAHGWKPGEIAAELPGLGNGKAVHELLRKLRRQAKAALEEQGIKLSGLIVSRWAWKHRGQNKVTPREFEGPEAAGGDALPDG